MTHLIDKAAVVAEIKRIDKSIGSDRFLSEYEQGCNQGKEDVCDDLLSFIDTLEVKEVDLNKEIKEVQRKYKTIEEYEGYPATIYSNSIEWIAKHFFELGLKAAQKGK